MVRRLILVNLGVFFVLALLGLIAPRPAGLLTANLMLQPWSVAHGQVWELVTYSFVQNGLLDIVFGMLTLWFCGSMLEGAYGGRWVGELYFTSVIGGAVLACLIAFTGLFHLEPALCRAQAPGPASSACMIAIGDALRRPGVSALVYGPGPREVHGRDLHPDRARGSAARIQRFRRPAATLRCALRLSVRANLRRGAAWASASREQYYGVRNAWYRSKRRRAAKKFEVYMSKQGRQVRFDDEGPLPRSR